MQFYRIGPARGAQRIGYARDPDTVRAKLADNRPEPLLVRTWDMSTGQAMLVERMVGWRLAGKALGDGWYDISTKVVDDAVNESVAIISAAASEALKATSNGWQADAMLRLRTEVFQTTQEMMGVITGRSAAIVWRWEAGVSKPGLDEVLRLRAFARAVGIPWEDGFLLEPPKTEV